MTQTKNENTGLPSVPPWLTGLTVIALLIFSVFYMLAGGTYWVETTGNQAEVVESIEVRGGVMQMASVNVFLSPDSNVGTVYLVNSDGFGVDEATPGPAESAVYLGQTNIGESYSVVVTDESGERLTSVQITVHHAYFWESSP